MAVFDLNGKIGESVNESHAGRINGTHRNTNGANGHTNGSNGDANPDTPPLIAIVGMGMRIPGGINDSESFWDLLINKGDAQSDIPTDRYNTDGFYSPYPKTGALLARKGYFLKDVDLAEMDAGFFSMSKSEVEKLDPQQRLLLEVVWEALENAGESNWRGKDVGCYIGAFAEDWTDLRAKDTQDYGMYRLTGTGDFLLSNRISYEYDLKGPSMTVKVGCSSSMVCLDLACEAIIRGDCSSAIVGAANIVMSPSVTILMCGQGALSPDGSCKSFDAKANGYARADGVNAIYIKRLDDAIRDGNPIRAVIRATSSNCDGKTAGVTMPSTEAHESLMRRAYELAGLQDLSKTAFVECHGTGTAVGDPLEVNAVANLFGDKGVYIGSVKPNVGHSESASGVTSIIKSVLSLEKRTIIPNIKFETPNPKIPFATAKLTVPVDPKPWPADRSERISVNSFGIGGANAHVILDSAASFGLGSKTSKGTVENPSLFPRLLVFSANHRDSLAKVASNHEQYLESHPSSALNLAYTLGHRRDHLQLRSFCITDGDTPFEISPVAKSKSGLGIVFVFTGQGAQWPEMGRDLINDYPSFQADIQAMDKALSALDHPPSWSIEEELKRPAKVSSISLAEFSQPLCTAIQVALVNLLRKFGVSPNAVAGHSSGEIAAAYTANAITLEEAIVIAYYRGFVTREHDRKGCMAALGLGTEQANEFLVPGVVVACQNSGSSVTISGDADKVKHVLEQVKKEKPDVFTRLLHVDIAYHSHHMQDLGSLYQTLIDVHVVPRPPQVPFYSTVTGSLISSPKKFDSMYWRQNLESPVLFHTALGLVLKGSEQNSVHLEIGPHAALAGPLKQIYREVGTTTPYISAISRNSNCTKTFLGALGQLHCNGISIDFEALNSGGITLSDLPNYPWNRARYWNESRVSKEWRLRDHPHHDILGSRVIEGNSIEPTWRNVLHVDDVPWIKDHLVHTDIVFPAAGYIAIVGEAIRQLSGTIGYTVRNMRISTALVLQPTKSTEVITSLRPSRLTDTLDSTWYSWSIMSYNGSTWLKHCVGEVRGGQASKYPVKSIKPLLREVPSTRWYQAMKKIGLNYGPAFVGRAGITAGVNESTCVATISNPDRYNESSYPLHPAIIDLIFQSLSVATCKGQPRLLTQLSLPTQIDELYIGGTAANEIPLYMAATGSLTRGVDGDGYGLVDGQVVFHLKSLRLSPLGEQSAKIDDNTHAAAQLLWKPHIDFVDPSTLLRPSRDIRASRTLLERIGYLCMIETYSALENATSKLDHHRKYYNWLKKELDRGRDNKIPLVKDANHLLNLSSSERESLIDYLIEECQHTEGRAVAIALSRIYRSARGIFEGTIDSLELLLADNVLTEIYNYITVCDSDDYFRLLSHHKPKLRILEIGAGTGGLTAIILRSLQSDFGERMYSEYTYTDISSGFHLNAKERFKNYSGIEYAVLDIGKDPIEQGFQEGSYDIIVAANVLHATPSLNTTLRHVRSLLRPDGRLFLSELCPTSKCINYIMGILPGWWLGEDDNRSDEPYVSPQRWEEELRNAGFAGVEAAPLDQTSPYHLNATILARPIQSTQSSKGITLLTSDVVGQITHIVEDMFVKRGLHVDFCTLSQEPTPGQDIVSLLDIEKPFFAGISESDLSDFLCLVSNLESRRVLWVTKASQIYCKDPEYSLAIGMSRTVRSELLAAFATLEIDSLESEAVVCDAIFKVYEKLQQSQEETGLDPDYEFALSDGLVRISRFHWISIPEESSKNSVNSGPKTLEIGTRGLLQTLQWVLRSRSELEADDVEVEVRAMGMNFKDVLIAMGIVDGRDPEKDDLGCECSGIVRRIGLNVQNVEVGDRVVVFSPGCLCTEMTIPSRLCTKIPDSLSFEEAATMPTVYSTVIRAIMELGKLEAGQSILVHSAAGGVGIAAIYLAKMIGADIYVTVGTPEKVEFVANEFGIDRSHIFNSRDDSFLNGLLQATNGRGVDLVLNSLSGELLHASWKCVANYGMMIEIGKRDLIGRGKLSMDIFEANRGYVGLDIAQIIEDRPAIATRLVTRTIELYEEGSIKPIHPITRFDAAAIEDAFRYLQKGLHTGKVVITMPSSVDDLPTAVAARPLTFRPDVSYLLIGGLGGLGQSTAKWMAEHGAKNLVFLSRSAGATETYEAFFNELVAIGCAYQSFRGSVTNLKDVENAVLNAATPIGGVLQMSMVLRDQPISEISIGDWEAVVSPKIQGTWNLHKALSKEKLDFFVLFSSVSGLIGNWGQANYAAANTFLDSFVQYRQSLGLPASVLEIGCMEEVGYVSQNPAVMEVCRSSAMYMLSERDFLESLQLIIERSTPLPAPKTLASTDGYLNTSQVAIGLASTLPLGDPSNRTIWKRDPRMAVYHNLKEQSAATSSSTDSELKTFLASITTDSTKLSTTSSVEFLAREIGIHVCSFLMKSEEELDTSLSLTAIGVDSLIAIEIRNWWRQSLGVEISVLELLNGGSIRQLGELAVLKLRQKLELASGGSKGGSDIREDGDTYLVNKAP